MQREFHFLVNTQREDACHAATETARWLEGLGVKVLFDHESGKALKQPVVAPTAFADADLVVTFGGDGTLIQAAQLCSEKATPILGVYYGRFGFVTQCDPQEVRGALRQFLDGESEIEERMMLKGELVRNEETVATLHALNEIALQRSIATRMMVFNVNIDWESVTSYPADGILVATPTGSTAYSLSAGGPIVDPQVRAMILTPITPHSLGARPLVLRPDTRVELSVDLRGDAVVSADGQSRLNLLTGDRVVVTKSERVTRLVQVDRSDFLFKLRTRLLWGARS
ncbi:MAG: NAD(+)/NADH kinase [Armatimonadetes bacterium]|nr:MAG: NAD(+)/NADH kinase [Armatimonadota bacterium]GIV02617.1 MAG: NAD kinase [Fimbriimonadales bacterium]